MHTHIGVRAGKVGRISGLDPADPNFQGQSNAAKLDKSDADFVDVIHSDANSFLIGDGMGTSDPSGHVDFWPNGGERQPHCFHLFKDSETRHYGDKGGQIACDHGAAVSYYRESINSDCSFTAKPCSSYNRYLSGKCDSCLGNPCPIMGYRAIEFKAYNYHNFKLFLKTSKKSPYCSKLTTIYIT